MLAALALIISIFAGCNNTDVPEETPMDTTQAADNSDAPTPSADGDSLYPLVSELTTLTLWTVYQPNSRPTNLLESTKDHPSLAYLEEITNVHIEFVEVPDTVGAEQFGIMRAGGSWCDMIHGITQYISGGFQEALDNDFLVDLSPYIEEYSPNYWAYINETTERFASTTLGDGRLGGYYAFSDEVLPSWGLAIRNDWLNTLGMEIPRTYNEVYEVLTAFKTEFGAENAFLMTEALQPGWLLAGGYGVSGYQFEGQDQHSHMFQIDGVVKSSLIEDGYRDYITMLNNWYSDGLFSSDFATVPWICFSPDNFSNVTANDVGLWYVNVNWMGDVKGMSDDPDFEFIGIGDIVENVGDTTHFTSQNNVKRDTSCGISTDCDNIPLAMQWMDFWYSQDGIILQNYGVYGQAWTVPNDEIIWEDLAEGNVTWDQELIWNTAEQLGMAPTNTTNDYCISRDLSFGIDLEKRLFGFYNEVQISTYDAWSDHVDGDWLLPALDFSSEEQSRVNMLLSDIETYASENVSQMIIGAKSLDEWDSFVAQLKTIGIDELIGIYQTALDGYYAKLGL